MKIGLFFGSFNPVHIGHMAIANYFTEFTDLEQVWFIVSPHNPMKLQDILLQDYHRLKLVQLAIGDYRKMKAVDAEFKLSKPSYTINTLLHLKEKYQEHHFVLLLGADNLETFHQWKSYEQILEQVEIYVYPRPEKYGSDLLTHPKVKMLDAPRMEISSTAIREAIKNKKDVRFMFPEAVFNYIEEMHFYEK